MHAKTLEVDLMLCENKSPPCGYTLLVVGPAAAVPFGLTDNMYRIWKRGDKDMVSNLGPRLLCSAGNTYAW